MLLLLLVMVGIGGGSYFTQDAYLTLFCGFDFYLKSLMRPGDLHPFIQGNRHIQTIFCCCF